MICYKIKTSFIVVILLSFATNIMSEEISLNACEKAWLKKKHTVRVRISSVPPLHFHNNKPLGISVDYMDYIAKKTGINVIYQTGIPWGKALEDIKNHRNTDLLLTIHKSPEREKFINFTEDYLFMPWVIISRGDFFIGKIEDLNGKRVAVERNFIIHKKLLKDYPNIDLIIEKSTEDALRTVATGKAEAYIGNLVISTYLIQNKGFNNLKVSAPTKYGDHTQAMGVRNDWPELASLITKIINSIPQEEHSRIQNKWLTITYDQHSIKKADVIKWVGIIIVISTILLTLFILWNRSLKREITAHKLTQKELANSQDRFKILFEKAPLGYQSLDENGDFMEVNETWLKIMGYSKDEVIGKNFSDFLLPEWGRHFAENFPRFKAVGEILGVEFEMLKKDGSSILVSFHGKIALDPDGNFKQTHCVFRDITQQRRVEKEQVIMEKQLFHNQKLEAIGTLAGGIAHDFNNMLGVIMGNVSYTLSSIDSSGEFYEVLSDIQACTVQAQSLTKQLLTFARGGAPVKKITDLNNLLKEFAKFSMRGSKAKSKFELTEDLWPVEVDAEQINQVIHNLVINANQAMPDGGIITITSENVEVGLRNNLTLEKGRYVKILVKDAGIGISEKNISKIFDPYFSTKQEGSGLGLATSFSIIKKHGGHLVVESELDVGAIFHFYLPASTKEVGLTEKKVTIRHKGTGTILIMDDDDSILKMIGRIVNRMGYETILTKDGTQAVEIYQKAFKEMHHIDLVILDLTVPGGMSGANAIIELLKIDPKIKAVVSSGYSNNPIMSNYQDYGFCGVIPKPYTIEQLSKLFNEVI